MAVSGPQDGIFETHIPSPDEPRLIALAMIRAGHQMDIATMRYLWLSTDNKDMVSTCLVRYACSMLEALEHFGVNPEHALSRVVAREVNSK